MLSVYVYAGELLDDEVSKDDKDNYNYIDIIIVGYHARLDVDVC